MGVKVSRQFLTVAACKEFSRRIYLLITSFTEMLFQPWRHLVAQPVSMEAPLSPGKSGKNARSCATNRFCVTQRAVFLLGKELASITGVGGFPDDGWPNREKGFRMGVRVNPANRAIDAPWHPRFWGSASRFDLASSAKEADMNMNFA